MTIRHISKSVFKAKALEIFRAVEASGEAVFVTDHGHPTLEVRRCVDTARRPLDILRASVIRYAGPTDPIEPDTWDAAQ